MKDRIDSIIKLLPPRTKLVAVSKYHSSDKILQAYNLGQRIFAESRPQELKQKLEALPKDIQWHFIGHLQSNKLKMVLPYVSLIHSVDSVKLLDNIASWAHSNEKQINILLQLHIAQEESKQGFTEEELYSLLEIIQFHDRYKYINIQGLMSMATNTDDTNIIEQEFARIEAIFEDIKERYSDKLPNFKELSIGMSNDFLIAIRHGATLVRVGTMIFGERDY